MLPKENRLKSNKEINQLFKEGKAVRNSFLFLKYRKNNLKNSRFAFSIGLKYSKKAVDRNSIKKTLRESTRPFLKRIKSGYDGVFFLSKGVCPDRKKINSTEVQNIIEGILKKANLIIK